MQRHEFAKIFPLMERKDNQAMIDDMRKHGLRQPLVTYKGKLIDGSNRFQICRTLRIEPTYVEFEGTEQEALEYVISANMLRRHMTKPQRAFAAAKIANLKHGQTKKTKAKSDPKITLKDAADRMDVGEMAVRDAKKVLEDGDPALQDAVDDGKIGLREGGELSKLPKEEQRKEVEKPKAKRKAKSRPPAKMLVITEDPPASAAKIYDFDADFAKALVKALTKLIEQGEEK